MLAGIQHEHELTIAQIVEQGVAGRSLRTRSDTKDGRDRLRHQIGHRERRQIDQPHTVEEFVEAAFSHVGLDWKKYVKVDPRYFRPAEVDLLVGDASKAKKDLGWIPKVKFKQLVQIMVDADVEELKKTMKGTSGTPIYA